MALEQQLAPTFRQLEQQYRLPQGLLTEVARAESGFDPKAVSPAGAQGLMQFMPATAERFGVDPWNPVSSATGAAKYLRTLLDMFDNRLDMALAGYNAGEGNVQRSVRRSERAGGQWHDYLPRRSETLPYMEKIMNAFIPPAGAQEATDIPRGQPAPEDLAAVDRLLGSSMDRVPAQGQQGPLTGVQPSQEDLAAVQRLLGTAPADLRQPTQQTPTEPADQPRDLPEFTSSADGLKFSQAARVAAGLLFATDPEQQVDIIRESVPEATIRDDGQGNTIVSMPDGQDYYLNAPGLSGRDVGQTLAQGLVYLGAMTPLGRGLTIPARAAGAALIGGGTSIALDAGAGALGSEQGINVGRAATTAGLSAGGEFLAPMAGPAVRGLRRLFANSRYYRNGQLTPAGRETLRQAGFTPDQMTPEALERFGQLVRTADDPAAAVRSGASQGLPVEVPMTRGQLTRDPEQMMFESNALKGVYGPQARTTMQGHQQDVQRALRGNVEAIQGQISGGSPQITAFGQAGAGAQQELARQADDLGRVVDASYDAARAAPGGGVPGSSLPRLTMELRGAVQSFDNPAALQKVEKLEALYRDAGPQRTTALVNGLFSWRQEVAAAQRATSDGTTRAAMTALKNQFDKTIKDLVTRDLMTGNKSLADLWQQAISKRAVYGRLFEGDDIIARLIERDPRSDKFIIAPEAVSNFLFGASNTGFVPKAQLARELRKLRLALGRDSQQWNALREEAFFRLAQQGEGAFQMSERQFSGVKFKQALDQALTRNPEVMRQLFRPEELQRMQQFAKVAANATGDIPGSNNYSNTAVALGQVGRRLLGAVFGSGRVDALLVGLMPGIARGVQAQSAVAGGLTQWGIPGGIGGAAGATYGATAD